MNLHKCIRDARFASGMTVEELAAEAGISPERLILIEGGQLDVSWKQAGNLAEALGFQARIFQVFLIDPCHLQAHFRRDHTRTWKLTCAICQALSKVPHRNYDL